MDDGNGYGIDIRTASFSFIYQQIQTSRFGQTAVNADTDGKGRFFFIGRGIECGLQSIHTEIGFCL